jgi:hypothetical protein
MIISYDFDGTLHSSVHPGTIHPMQFHDAAMWEPNESIFAQMREDAEIAEIVVVSARPPESEEVMWEFIHMHGLPVDRIYCTDNTHKSAILQEIGASKHYDDSTEVGRELRGTGIKFVLIVDGETVNESAMQNIKKFNEFRS